MHEEQKACLDTAISQQATSENSAAPCIDDTTNDWIVASILPSGRENAISPEYLSSVLGFKNTRALRKEIERERRAGAIICSSLEAGGYFLPESVEELRHFVRTQQMRADTTEACLIAAKNFLREVDDDD